MRTVALTALLVLSTVLLPGIQAQDVEPDLPVDDQHCTLPTPGECLEAWKRMIREPKDFRTWLCNFITGGTDPRCI